MLSLLPDCPMRSKTNITINKMRQLLTDIDVYSHTGNDRNAIRRIVATNSESIALNHAFAILFKSATNDLLTSGTLVSSNELYLDAWGTPLFFSAPRDSEYHHVNPQLIHEQIPVAVWSAGPNLQSEFGYGDDVYSAY